MRVGLLVSILTFIVVGGDVLLEQLIGRASASFVFGTACLIAAACAALFAFVVMIGLVISGALGDEPPFIGP